MPAGHDQSDTDSRKETRLDELPIPFRDNVPNRMKDLFEQLERVSRSNCSEATLVRRMSLIMIDIIEENKRTKSY
jgi:hypothetical protein